MKDIFKQKDKKPKNIDDLIEHVFNDDKKVYPGINIKPSKPEHDHEETRKDREPVEV